MNNNDSWQKNYEEWRRIHANAFGEVFSSAFSENAEAQTQLTAALIKISRREFTVALTMLEELRGVCSSDFDSAAVDYFIGLNYEMLGNESEMTESYEKVREADVRFVFPVLFHPYYRTAKLAQRDSECAKAVFYFRKALEFYDGAVPDERISPSVSQIIYDVATVNLYMHRYDEAERFLALSERYDSSENQHRTYIKAILYAVQGKKEESIGTIAKLNDFQRAQCLSTVTAIFDNADLHYCTVVQDRSGFDGFWSYISLHKSELEELARNKESDVGRIISEKLSEVFAFMKRELDCRVEAVDGKLLVCCKNYCVKTLMLEYEALFVKQPIGLDNWIFRSVNQFETPPI